MRFLSLTLISLLAIFQQVSTTGFLDIRLKSAHDQKATVILSDGTDSTYLVLPIILSKDEEMKFGDLLINFNKTYKVEISLDETESLGLSKSLYKGEITPIRGTTSPKTLNLPLTGIRFDFKCETNWSGEKCDVFCDESKIQQGCSTSEIEKTWKNDVEIDVDYTVNPQKLQTIVSMLKKENEISNSFITENLEGQQLLKEIMESSGEQPK